MTDLFEKPLVIDLFYLNKAFDKAVSALYLDTDLNKCLRGLVFAIQDTNINGGNFSFNNLQRLATFDCFDYEISRKWFSDKPPKLQMIAI